MEFLNQSKNQSLLKRCKRNCIFKPLFLSKTHCKNKIPFKNKVQFKKKGEILFLRFIKLCRYLHKFIQIQILIML